MALISIEGLGSKASLAFEGGIKNLRTGLTNRLLDLTNLGFFARGEKQFSGVSYEVSSLW